jgi:hypothetical protein
MQISRRRLFQSVAVAGSGAAGQAAQPVVSLDVLHSVSAFHGTNLSDERLRVVKPVLEHRLEVLQPLRDFEVDDSTAPAEGILR